MDRVTVLPRCSGVRTGVDKATGLRRDGWKTTKKSKLLAMCVDVFRLRPRNTEHIGVTLNPCGQCIVFYSYNRIRIVYPNNPSGRLNFQSNLEPRQNARRRSFCRASRRLGRLAGYLGAAPGGRGPPGSRRCSRSSSSPARRLAPSG